RLILYANGLQVGYRHEGDYDVLNQCDDEAEAPGRFFYQTVPLPMSLTRGKSTVTLRIAALGRMWPYGQNFAQYQKDFARPSRSIYRIYTHTNPRYVPDANEKQGAMPTAAVRTDAGEEVIAQSKQIVIDRLNRLLAKPVPAGHSGSQRDRAARLTLMADAYNTAWTPTYHDPRTIDQIVQDGDSMAADFAHDPAFAGKDWPGAGPLGQAVMLTWPAVSSRLDEQVVEGTQSISRRTAWASALKQSVDYWRTHRRSYTNQSMIVDWNIYAANRALQLIDPAHALPEAHVRDFLYQAIGLKPWLGSDARTDGALVSDTPDKGTEQPYGDAYQLITRKGLSRELGWVGTYGETILRFTCDMARMTGDPKIRAQLAAIEHARMYFRYPGLDGDGFRCMKLVSEIDNRTAHFPLGGSAYTAPDVREEWRMNIPAMLSDDPITVGAAQQMLEDNQYFTYVRSRLKDPDTLGMMLNVDEYEKVKTLPRSAYRMPMTPGRPDFVFADEEDAVLAIKHGQTCLFVNLYFRAERAVNDVARIYEQTPSITRIVTARTQTVVNESGKTYTRPDWIDGIRGRGMPPAGETIHQAWAGEILPIARRTEGAKLPAYGDWGPFLGKAEFYELHYGPYLILVNSSKDRSFAWKIPPEFLDGTDLVSGTAAKALLGTSLKPLTTVVLYHGAPDPAR
ncbi:MAG: hypothetical protein ACTHLZ_10705, partial [Tepidisphaeraceae bacterium]